MNGNQNYNKMITSSTTKAIVMRSTALTIVLVQIMYISFARGFVTQTSYSSPNIMLHRHTLQATRQDRILGSSNTRPITPSRSLQTTTTTNNNQYTQFFKENVLVGIQRTSPNSRRISGEMIMNIPIDVIWSILTDYDNLSVHVPNLVESRVIRNTNMVGRRGSRTGSSSSSMPRVYQRGAQRIFGFEFGADVTMDMKEHVHHHVIPGGSGEEMSKQCVIDFKCVDSQFFSEFDGSWIVEEYKDDDNTATSSSDSTTPITMVRYVVDVRPKGPVPVAALEWRIKEDVPVNILAVSKAATAALARQQHQQIEQKQRRQRRSPANTVAQASPSSSNQQQDQRTVAAALFPRRSRSQRYSSPRQKSSPPQPLQRLTNQAANNLKRTAKSVLPSPVYSTAKQAVNIINNNLTRARRNDASVMPSMTLRTESESRNDSKTENTSASGGCGGSNSRDMDVDWYEDETMAMYL